MRRQSVFGLASLLVLYLTNGFGPVLAQNVSSAGPLQDAQAVQVLQTALNEMGKILPNDCVATGSVNVVAGSTSETGTVQLLSRGMDQSSETIAIPSARYVNVYSHGLANQQINSSTKTLPLERAPSVRSALFPVQLMSEFLSNADMTLKYVGQETFDGVPALHIRVWNTFKSKPDWQVIAEFTTKDLWFDISSGLLLRMSYVRRDSGGNSKSAIPIPVDVLYSDYRTVGGVRYPFLIKEDLNGTPWLTVEISNVSFNTGLSDSDFPIILGAR